MKSSDPQNMLVKAVSFLLSLYHIRTDEQSRLQRPYTMPRKRNKSFVIPISLITLKLL